MLRQYLYFCTSRVPVSEAAMPTEAHAATSSWCSSGGACSSLMIVSRMACSVAFPGVSICTFVLVKQVCVLLYSALVKQASKVIFFFLERCLILGRVAAELALETS